jgi:hypothetical protein
MRGYDPGAINIISGSPGTGKTDLSLRLCEQARKKDPRITIVSNIPLAKNPDWYYHYTRLSGILWFITALPRSILVIDEAGIYATSGAGGDTDTRGILERLVKICRKFGLSIIWIDQTVTGSVPPKIRQMSTYHWQKLRRDLVSISSGDRDLGTLTVPPSMRTTLPFNTLGFSSLKLDITPSEFLALVDNLSDTPGDIEEIRDSLRNWLITNDLAPPKIPLFLSWSKEREEKEEGGASPAVLPGKKKIPDPDDPIDTRTLMYGVLQRNPRAQASDLARILKVDTGTIYHYRKEYKRRILPGKENPQPFPDPDPVDLPEMEPLEGEGG